VGDDGEDWYLQKASMVFPTAEVAKEAAGMGVEGLVLKWGGVH